MKGGRRNILTVGGTYYISYPSSPNRHSKKTQPESRPHAVNVISEKCDRDFEGEGRIKKLLKKASEESMLIVSTGFERGHRAS